MSLVYGTDTAAQKALRLAEIVALIAEELYDDVVTCGDSPLTLRSFIHVNHLWFDSAIHLLWRHLSDCYDRDLVGIFQLIHPSRHSFYAAFVQDACVKMEYPSDKALVNFLRKVEFPMLKRLRVDWDGDWRRIQIPVLGRNAIKEVNLLHQSYTFRSSARMMQDMFGQCLVSLPSSHHANHEAKMLGTASPE